MPDFRQIIVLVDVDAEFDFLELARDVFALFFLLGKFVAEFAEIDDAANGRLGVRGDFDEIAAERLGFAERVRRFHHA